VLTGGADFGGGVWDLLATGPRKEAQRDHIATSLAPIWEANHVWLIIVVVMLFTAFPAAFSAVSVVLHIPLTVMLIGIVLRGTAFVFRSYGAHTEVQRHRWGIVFSIASVVTPVFLGIVVGALATGAVGAASRLTGQPDIGFRQVFIGPWLAPFPMVIGALALVLFAYLAAVYLAFNAPTDELRNDFRARALIAAGAAFVIAVAALMVAIHQGHGDVVRGVLTAPVQLLTAAAGITALVSLWNRRYRVARIAAGAQVVGILIGWAAAQYPSIVPGRFTIADAAAPRETLRLLLIGLVAGMMLLIPALRYLYRLFLRPNAT
jgi:cytochrome d ubiquinol oxidase subunit II